MLSRKERQSRKIKLYQISFQRSYVKKNNTTLDKDSKFILFLHKQKCYIFLEGYHSHNFFFYVLTVESNRNRQ